MPDRAFILTNIHFYNKTLKTDESNSIWTWWWSEHQWGPKGWWL